MRVQVVEAWRVWDDAIEILRTTLMLQGADAAEILEEGAGVIRVDEVVVVAETTSEGVVVVETTIREDTTITIAVDREEEVVATAVAIRAPGTRTHTAASAGLPTKQDQLLRASTEANRQQTQVVAW